jgi:mono/diheme cytochrome c family protein
MPLLGWHLSDRQVAAVATFIRNSWGNAAGIVSEGDAARVRGKVASRTE